MVEKKKQARGRKERGVVLRRKEGTGGSEKRRLFWRMSVCMCVWCCVFECVAV